MAGFKQAYSTLSDGHVSVYGKAQFAAMETAKSASKANGVQNTGSTGSTLTGDNPSPTPIDLPL